MKFKSALMNDLWSRRKFVQLGGSLAASRLITPWSSLSAASSPSLKSGTYLNPVIAGDHPDAGAIRVGNDYYLTHTTDHYTPGLLIWHSTDLVHWKVAGAALDQILRGGVGTVPLRVQRAVLHLLSMQRRDLRDHGKHSSGSME